MASAYKGPTEVELEPDIDMIRWHLQWNFEAIHYGEIEVSYTDPRTGAVNRDKRFDISELDEAAEYINEINQTPGQNAYFRPASFKVTNKDKKDADFERSPGVWVDCDTLESAKGLKSKTSDLSYNAYTITGRHPHTRVQAFWRFNEPLTDAENVRHWNDVLCKLVGGDPNVKNVSTLMRCGGTIAWPYKDVEQRRPELTQFVVKGGEITEPEFVEKLIKPYAPVIELAEKTTPGLGLLADSYNLQAVLKDISEGLNRHDNVVSAAAHMVAKNYPDWMIYDTLKNACEKFFTWSDTLEAEITAAVNSARSKFDPEDLQGTQIKDQAAEVVQQLRATPYKIIGGHNVPPREWLGFNHYIRSFLSATVAPGGVGKSSNAITEALSMAVGRDLLAKKDTPGTVNEKLKVWVFNLEDPYTELQRRVEAATQYFNLTQDDIGDRLLVDSGRDQQLVVAKEIERQVVVVEPIKDSLISEIKRLGIDVLIIDPFVNSHRVSENSNEHIAQVSDVFREICDTCNCSIELIHHTRKLDGREVSAEDARGASGLVGAARSVRAISRVGKEAVERHGIKDDYRRFFFFGDGKTNLTPPPDHNAWRKLASVSLENETDQYPSDEIGVVEAYQPPDPFSGITVHELRNVQSAMLKGDPRVRKSDQATDWFGYLVGEMCNIDTVEKPDRSRIKQIIKTWIANRMITETTVKNKARQEVPGYAVEQYAND